jgi:hypothetical protein
MPQKKTDAIDAPVLVRTLSIEISSFHTTICHTVQSVLLGKAQFRLYRRWVHVPSMNDCVMESCLHKNRSASLNYCSLRVKKSMAMVQDINNNIISSCLKKILVLCLIRDIPSLCSLVNPVSIDGDKVQNAINILFCLTVLKSVSPDRRRVQQEK